MVLGLLGAGEGGRGEERLGLPRRGVGCWSVLRDCWSAGGGRGIVSGGVRESAVFCGLVGEVWSPGRGSRGSLGVVRGWTATGRFLPARRG